MKVDENFEFYKLYNLNRNLKVEFKAHRNVLPHLNTIKLIKVKSILRR